jgi:hypothetical protein
VLNQNVNALDQKTAYSTAIANAQPVQVPPPSRAAMIVNRLGGSVNILQELCGQAENIADRVMGPCPTGLGSKTGGIADQTGLLGEIDVLGERLSETLSRMQDALSRIDRCF